MHGAASFGKEILNLNQTKYLTMNETPILKKISPSTWLGRLAVIYVMLIIPIFSFGLTWYNNPLEPSWQSGRMSDYTAIIFNRSISLYFYPFLLWSMGSTLLLLWSDEKFARYWPVRCGIYSGVVVAIQYTILLTISTNFISLVIGIISLGLGYVFYNFTKNNKLYNFPQAIMIGVIIWLFISFILFIPGINIKLPNRLELPFLTNFFIALLSGPVWCTFITYTLSSRLYHHYDQHILSWSVRYLTWPIMWLLGYATAWYLAVQRTLDIYASLRTSPPQCVWSFLLLFMITLLAWSKSTT